MARRGQAPGPVAGERSPLRWDFQFFRETCGHIEVEVTLSKGQRETQTLESYLHGLDSTQAATTKPYLRGWYYERDAPWLSEDLWKPGDFHDLAFEDGNVRSSPQMQPKSGRDHPISIILKSFLKQIG